MSFLDTLRAGTDSTMTRVIIGLVGVAVIVSMGGRDGSSGGSIYAVVDGQAITKSEFDDRMRNASRQANRTMTDEQRKQLAAGLLENMIFEEVELQQAADLHIGVSAEEIARVLKDIEAFQKDGKFDEDTYQRTLRANGQTTDRFEASVRRQLLVSKVAEFAKAGVVVGESEVREAWKAYSTEFDIQYVRLPQALFLDSVPVAAADRDAYIASNKDGIKKRYDEQFESKYNLPKRYTLSEIVLRTDLPGVDKAATKAKAEQVAALAAAPGADFADLARTWSEDITASSGGSLGQRTPTQLDSVLVAGADAAGVGKVSPALETGRGFEIIRVEAIDDARVIAIEEAQASIAETILRESKVGEVQRAYATKIVDAWRATGSVPRDLTEAQRLPVDQTGAFSMDAREIPGMGAQPMLQGMLATAKTGEVFPIPFESRGTLFVAALSSRTDPTEEDYQTQKAGVRLGLLRARQDQFLNDWKTALVAEATVERMVNFKADEQAAAPE